MNPHGNHKYKNKDEEVRCKVIIHSIIKSVISYSATEEIPGRCMKRFI